MNQLYFLFPLKILSFSKFTLNEGTAGQAINLMSNDVSRFDWLMCFTDDVWKAPIASAVAAYFIFTQVGYSGLVGMAIIIMFMPLHGNNNNNNINNNYIIKNVIPFKAWLGKKSANIRLETALRTDTRVETMYSIINGIQVIKMFGWEKAFERLINSIRKHEIKAITKGYYVKATFLSFEFLTSFAVFVTLVLYVYMGNQITAQKAFVTIAYFNYVNRHLVYFWPMAVTSLADGWISLKRVESFLVQETSKMTEKQIPLSATTEITLKNASAYWNKDERSFNGITSVDLSIEPRQLTAVVGHVGCGKSSLLEVILKELPLSQGTLEVGGTISYAAQKAWIFEGSVKNNIIFIEEFDEIRYKKVIHACDLECDLEQLPHGDETIVGERGISLSGGQKARINLARAIYKAADIYLLDDILSAVDPVVGKNIFNRAIKQFLNVSLFFTTKWKVYYQYFI